ncbi:MAG: WG repeat-containing protein, partial [Oscillospiraceae bacterium]|nr:WG repeat-containing protein [Oscillospiraceae bacterium]
IEFKENGKYGHIDNNGKLIVILPGEYDSIDNFCEGLACVKKGEKYGFINADCRLVIPYEYDSAVSFRDGVAAVGNDGKKGLIDKSGNAVLPLQYDSILTPMNVTAPFFIIKDGSRLGILAQSDLSKYVTEPEPAPAPVEPAPKPPVSTNTAYASTQNVEIDGKAVEVQAYALKDANGNPTNYVKLRDVAMLLNGSAAQFEVSWDGAVNIVTGQTYTANGSEMFTPFSGDRSYTIPTAATKINGAAADLAAITLTDDAGGGYTYYQLRDLGRSLGFNVGWSAERGIYVETDKAYVG